jgi:hypothetical protein
MARRPDCLLTCLPACLPDSVIILIMEKHNYIRWFNGPLFALARNFNNFSPVLIFFAFIIAFTQNLDRASWEMLSWFLVRHTRT